MGDRTRDMWNFSQLSVMNVLDTDFFSGMASCPANCSGNGDCMNGTCLCAVQYKGGGCDERNNSYFISFSVIFYVLCAISIIQLILCNISEYHKMKHPSCLGACRMTTQKLLYIFVIFATFSRGLYFTLEESLPSHWQLNLLTLYYLLLLSCGTLVVCFWAEIFHLQGKQEKPGFLGKSLNFFIIFNTILYLLTLGQFIASIYVDEPQRLSQYLNGLIASLIIIEVIFFLAYGVEVFFKLKGAFTDEVSTIDPSSLHGSRLGLIFQGVLQILTAFFLMMSVMEAKWKDSIPQSKRNFYDVIFRVVELGVVLWFPCVLWNSSNPEKLWILNPSVIVRPSRDEENTRIERDGERDSLNSFRRRKKNYEATADASRDTKEPECWICYDRENMSAGPLIQPCCCTGDVAYVHHECLRKWLLESMEEPENTTCKVCKTQYQLARGIPRLYRGVQFKSAVYLTVSLAFMFSSPVGVYYVMQNNPFSSASIASIGACVLLEMMCLKCLGYQLKNVWDRAKIFSLIIVGKTAHSISQEISNDDSVSYQGGRRSRTITACSAGSYVGSSGLPSVASYEDFRVIEVRDVKGEGDSPEIIDARTISANA